jgi:primary-amine oxidase
MLTPQSSGDTMTVGLKPSGFFDQNPALDVPQSMQKSNGSRLAEGGALVAAVREQSYHKVRDSRL